MSRIGEDLQDAFDDNKTAMERRDRDKNKLERLQAQLKWALDSAIYLWFVKYTTLLVIRNENNTTINTQLSHTTDARCSTPQPSKVLDLHVADG